MGNRYICHMRNPGQLYVDQALLLRRYRSGTNDCYLHYLIASGEVVSLFLRNGMASTRRMGDSLGSFGVSEIRWRSDRQQGGGRLISVEGFRLAPWHGAGQGYAVVSVLMEIAAAEHKPGSMDRRGADVLFPLMMEEAVPTVHAIFAYLHAAGYVSVDSTDCPDCGVTLLNPEHDRPRLDGGAVCCPRRYQGRDQLPELLAGILGAPSKFLGLI